MREYITNRWKPSKERYAEIKHQAVLYKGESCKNCRGIFEDSVYDFHHRDPALKVMSISHMIHLGLMLEDLKPELDKCDLLCANCHRLVTNSKKGKKLIRKKLTLQQRFREATQEDATAYRPELDSTTASFLNRSEVSTYDK